MNGLPVLLILSLSFVSSTLPSLARAQFAPAPPAAASRSMVDCGIAQEYVRSSVQRQLLLERNRRW
jgi:hypothetical protein